MSVTDSVSNRLARLPLWVDFEAQQDYVIERVIVHCGQHVR